MVVALVPRLLHSDQWLLATRNSFIVGIATMILATILGTLCALGIFLGRFRGKALLVAMLTTPMVVPVIVTAVAIYFGFSFVGLNNTLTGLVLAHTVLSVPYVLLTVLATLTTFDRNLLKAAATCGAPPRIVFTRVVLPLIAPGVATGALFAFATSFDELVVAIFVSSPGQFTLPRQMFAGLREFLSPTIAAAAVLLILCSVLLLVANEMLRARAKARIAPIRGAERCRAGARTDDASLTDRHVRQRHQVVRRQDARRRRSRPRPRARGVPHAARVRRARARRRPS